MTSAEFLALTGYARWRDFDHSALYDASFIDAFSPTARPDLYEDPVAPVTTTGGRVVCRLGEIDGNMYMQYQSYWINPQLCAVAALYRPPGTSFKECDMYFFSRSNDRVFRELDPEGCKVRAAIAVFRTSARRAA